MAMSFLSKFWHQTLRRPYYLHKKIDIGHGKHTVLLLHGLGTTASTWEPLVKQIDKSRYRVIAFDLLGFGSSPKPGYIDYDVQDHAGAVWSTYKKLVGESSVIIIAHSMGCLIASHLATLRPELISRLILYAPPLFADSPEFRSHKRRRNLYFSIYEEMLRRPRILFTYSRFVARFARRMAITLDPGSWLPFERSLKNTIMKQQAYKELEKVGVPTDIIYGKFDFIITRTEVKDMLDANKNVQFHLVNEMHDVTTRSSRYILQILQRANKHQL